jgi:hypothetical protein
MVSKELDERGKQEMQKLHDKDQKQKERDLKIMPYVGGAVGGAVGALTGGQVGAAAGFYEGFEGGKQASKWLSKAHDDISLDPKPKGDVTGDTPALPSVPEKPDPHPGLGAIDYTPPPINVTIYGGQGAGVPKYPHEPVIRPKRHRSHKTHHRKK